MPHIYSNIELKIINSATRGTMNTQTVFWHFYDIFDEFAAW